MTAKELREKYFEFFKQKGHALIPSASLIPENDPTVLFTTAGMHPLVPFLLGEKHPAGNRLVSVQKCIRTGDIDEVGDAIHHTFFEMLGNWSLGDYFKKEAIEMSFEFLTDKKWLGLDKNKLAISVFAGDENAEFDEEAYNAWKNLVISEKRIAKLPKKNNWWGPAGQTGPCGPDTEMFYWTGNDKDLSDDFNPDDGRWVEIWNDVFMQYNKIKDGVYEPLKQKNVDTGMGLERTLAVLNGLDDNYQTELFLPIIKRIEELSDKKYQDYKKEFRIIADHIKAAIFMLAEKIEPSNTERGYVLRRLIRRAVRYGKLIGIQDQFCSQLVQTVLGIYPDIYLELKNNKEFIEQQLALEEEKFRKTLKRGEGKLLELFNKESFFDENKTKTKGFDNYQEHGRDFFVLFSEDGFPIELSIEVLAEKMDGLGWKLSADMRNKIKEAFDEEFQKHQELSRTASAGMFKAGLADHSEIVIKYHTATHLLHKALQIVLGDHIAQKGSNITAERLRFDFSHPQKMTDEEIKKVEDIVNEKIKESLPVIMEEMSLDQAKKIGATALFAEKYGDRVKVYSIGDYSKEVCGGPHVQNTKELGQFKIIKEEAVSAGVRRIKAVLE